MEVIATAKLTPCSPTRHFTLIPSLKSSRYIRSERSIILLNFCLSIVCSNILILVGQTQTHNVVSADFAGVTCVWVKCGGRAEVPLDFCLTECTPGLFVFVVVSVVICRVCITAKVVAVMFVGFYRVTYKQI